MPSKKNNRLVQAILLISFCLLTLVIFIFRKELAEFAKLGYFGIFIVTFLGSATVFLPLPGSLLVIAAASAFNPVIVALVSGLGESLGEMIGYIVGRAGKHLLISEDRRYKKVQTFMHRHGVWPVFILAAIPNPIFDVVGVISGAMHLSPVIFFLSVLTGKLIKNLFLVKLGGRF